MIWNFSILPYYHLCLLNMKIPNSLMKNDVPNLISNIWTIACSYMSHNSWFRFRHILCRRALDQNHDTCQSYGQAHEPRPRERKFRITNPYTMVKVKIRKYCKKIVKMNLKHTNPDAAEVDCFSLRFTFLLLQRPPTYAIPAVLPPPLLQNQEKTSAFVPDSAVAAFASLMLLSAFQVASSLYMVSPMT